MTPPALLELPGSPAGWAIRVFPNRFPVFSAAPGSGNSMAGEWFRRAPAIGSHEVIVESPDHSRFPDQRTPEEFALLVRAYQMRTVSLRQQRAIAYVLIFKNHGAGAGTSLEHPHSQVIGTAIEPDRPRRIARRATVYWREHGRCQLCDVLRHELDAGERIVLETERFVVLEPFAAQRPAETWLIPRNHSTFTELAADDVLELSAATVATLRLLKAAFGDPDYNYALHQDVAPGRAPEFRHWYLQILPCLQQPAGFELGSGMSINTLAPERAAELLRGAIG